MNPFIEIGLWALMLVLLPFIIELSSLNRLIEKDHKVYFYAICGLRRSANLFLFISLIYLIGNLLIPIIILLIIENLIGILLYRRIIKKISLNKLIINIFITNLISWIIVYSTFKLVFMNLK